MVRDELYAPPICQDLDEEDFEEDISSEGETLKEMPEKEEWEKEEEEEEE